MGNIFREEVDMYNEFLQLSNAIVMPQQEDKIGICKELKRVRNERFERVCFDFDSIDSSFIQNLRVLGKGTQRYFEAVVPKIKIVKDNAFRTGDAQIVGNKTDQFMYVSSRPFTDTDFVAASHEYGHVPSLRNPSKNEKEYYEYLEVIPMYFEYLALCRLKGKDKGQRQFVLSRLMELKEEADRFIRENRRIRGNGSFEDQAYETRKNDSYKYIKSFEYTLQLIERASQDQKSVNLLLDQVVTGDKSMRSIERPLEIDTRGCKRILSLIPKK